MQLVLKLGQVALAIGVLFGTLLGNPARSVAEDSWLSGDDAPVLVYMEEWVWGDPHVQVDSFQGFTSKQELFDYVMQMDSLQFVSCAGGILSVRWIDDRSEEEADAEASIGSASLKLAFGTAIIFLDGPLPFADVIGAGLILDGLIDTAEAIDDELSGTSSGSNGSGNESGEGGESGGSGGSGGGDSGDTGGGGGAGGSGDGGGN